MGPGFMGRQCCCSEVLRSSSTHAFSRSIAMTLSSIVRSISARRHSSTADKIALTRLSSASVCVVVIVVLVRDGLSQLVQPLFKRLYHVQHLSGDFGGQVRLHERGKIGVAQFRAAMEDHGAKVCAAMR
jgi:hypothetical protein